MTMTTRKRTPRTPRTPSADGTVSVDVVEPHLVYHDGEQRGGHLDNINAATATRWARQGWVTITPTADEPIE
jgi:hypothetical protein